MNNLLDIRTLALTNGIVCISLAMCMVLVAVTRKTYPGFLEWTGASVANGIGMVLLGLRDIWPDLLTVIVSNALLMSALSLVVLGLARFTGAKSRVVFCVAPVAAVIVSFAYFTYLRVDVDLRIVVFSLIGAAVLGHGVYIERTKYAVSGMRRNGLLAAALILNTAWYLIRAILTYAFDRNIVDFMFGGSLQTGSFLVFLVWSIWMTAVLIMANAQRLEHELQGAQREIRTLSDLLPICASCKKIRASDGAWHNIETYIRARTGTEFSHSICPDCEKKLYPEYQNEEPDGTDKA
jgi:hypothetical protein